MSRENCSSPVQCPFIPAPPPNGKGAVEAFGEFVESGDAPACNVCGSLMVRSGTCYRCVSLREHKRMLVVQVTVVNISLHRVYL